MFTFIWRFISYNIVLHDTYKEKTSEYCCLESHILMQRFTVNNVVNSKKWSIIFESLFCNYVLSKAHDQLFCYFIIADSLSQLIDYLRGDIVSWAFSSFMLIRTTWRFQT